MRILLCTETYIPVLNGVVTFLQMLTHQWRKEGHEVLIVAPDHTATHNYIKDGVLHCPAIESERLLVDLAIPIDPIRFALVKEFNPHIVHIQHEWGISLFGLEVARILDIPVIYTLHSEYSKYLEYAVKKYMIPLAEKTLAKIITFIVKRATIITSPSYKGELYLHSIGIHNKVEVIQNGVQWDDFDPLLWKQTEKDAKRSELAIGKDDILALCVGRLGPEKSVDVLLSYWAEALQYVDKCTLLLIGGGPDEKKLQEKARELHIDNKVRFVGKVPHNFIPLYYALCDLYCTASISEMHSVSLLEGLASGLPVIQRLDEPNRSQIKEGLNGWIVENKEQFAQKMISYCALSKEERVHLREQVRESIKCINSPKALADSYMKQYQRALVLHEKR